MEDIDCFSREIYKKSRIVWLDLLFPNLQLTFSHPKLKFLETKKPRVTLPYLTWSAPIKILIVLFDFAGFNREIPGVHRFKVIGDESHGVHNLHITNVSLEDDGEYQCQVTPMLTSHAIRASARLTVLRK